MHPAVTVQAPTANTAVTPGEVDIEAKFQRMLQTDQTSPEFAALWAEVDAYLDAAIAAERAITEQ